MSDDRELKELFEMFFTQFNMRINNLKAALNNKDTALIAKIAHQIKGASGIYGFNQISEAAGQVEEKARNNKNIEEIANSISNLIEVSESLS